MEGLSPAEADEPLERPGFAIGYHGYKSVGQTAVRRLKQNTGSRNLSGLPKVVAQSVAVVCNLVLTEDGSSWVVAVFLQFVFAPLRQNSTFWNVLSNLQHDSKLRARSHG